MRAKFYLTNILIFVLILGCLFSLAGSLTKANEIHTSGEPPLSLFERIRATIVYAQITQDAQAYDDWGGNRKEVARFNKGEIVEIIRDRSFEWYLTRSEDGREGWVSREVLSIPSDSATNQEQLSTFELENYVNLRNLDSKTDQLVWVDIDRQLTYVFVGKKGAWKLHRTMPCSTGRNVSPTLRGLHEIAERGDWFFTERLGRGGRNWVQFSGPYLFHSLPMDKQGNITDYTLMERRSAGCIRLSMDDSKWFYSFIKRGSTVFVN